MAKETDNGALYAEHDSSIRTSDSVYHPSEDTWLAVSLLENWLRSQKDADLLEIGTGTGAIGITAAKSANVKSVTMTDISEEAVTLAKENAVDSGVSGKCSICKSDLFENVSGKFDMIIFNPPYLPDDEVKGGKNEWSGGATGIETTARFLKHAGSFLKENGSVIIVQSSFSDTTGLSRAISDNKFRLCGSESRHIFFEDITALLLTKSR